MQTSRRFTTQIEGLANRCIDTLKRRRCVRLAAIAGSTMVLFSCGQPHQDSAPTVSTENGPQYKLGTIVNFNAVGDSEKYRVGGWNPAEAQFTWTNGTSAMMEFVLEPEKGPLSLRIRLAGLIKPPELPSQPVEVYANDTKIADWEVANTADFDATIPTKVLRPDGKVTIVLKLPKAVSPKSLGVSQDPRVLAVSCFQVQISREKTGTD